MTAPTDQPVATYSLGGNVVGRFYADGTFLATIGGEDYTVDRLVADAELAGGA